MPKPCTVAAVPWVLCAACSTFNADRVLDATFEVLPADFATLGQVGTAFALEDGTYVSAAHVLNGIIGSRYDQPFLLDRNAAQYPIEEIVRYSQRDDFVVFRARPSPLRTGQTPEHAQLSAAPVEPQAGQTLYVAGHSSTSRRVTIVRATAETPTGQEKSPHQFPFRARTVSGMSGGPVLDEQNNVIGVFTEREPAASEAEDSGRNRAVSLKTVLTPEAVDADVDMEDVVRALNLYEYTGILGSTERGVFARAFFAPDPGETATHSRSFSIPLGKPMSYAAFAAKVVGMRDAYFERILKRWIQDPDRRVLASGESATSACELLTGGTCPEVGATARDVLLATEAPRVAALTREGPTVYTALLDGVRVLRRKTDSPMTVGDVCHTGPPMQRPAQLALQVDERWRGRRSFRLETAGSEELYEDLHGNAWQLCVWPVKEQDMKLIALARPRADGYVALVRLVPTSLGHAATLHLKALANLDSVAAPERRSAR